ncbi:putative glycoside hydrolase [Rubripirellula reticaptiva]|nr:putative glycoside hydrolase [Rubripirellula reticaptiva]
MSFGKIALMMGLLSSLLLTCSGDLNATEPVLDASAKPSAFPDFSWDRVPLNIHFGKRTVDVTDGEIEFLASHSRFIVLEKSHGARVHGSTEAGIADTARRIVARNPDAKVLFYLNAMINWPGYEAFDSYRPEWTLRNAAGETVKHNSGVSRPDPSNAEFREWWSDVVVQANRNAPLAGVFIDALPQAIAPAMAKQVGDVKARAVVEGLREMIAMTKRKLGPESIVLVNGLRATDYREILDWEGIDGVMVEHFDAFRSTSAEDIKADLDSIELAAEKGKFVVIKGWPGFNWLDREMMKRPHAELLELARQRITFPLACFLIGAQSGTHFCYSWGYTNTDGMLDSYSELERPLGPPKSAAQWNGMTATRDFEHASVSIDLSNQNAHIQWHVD